MMNPTVMEALYSATYVEDYIDACENLPDDVQRQLSRMRELDVACQGYMRDAEISMTKLLELQDAEDSENVQKEVSSVSWKLQQLLISVQEVGDEKIQIAQQIQDFVDNKVRQLDLDQKNLGIESGSTLTAPESSFVDFQASSRGDREVKPTQQLQQNGPPERNTIIKRARRARHEVFVPSILGPSTLAPTRFTSEEQKEKIEKIKSEAGAGSSKSSSVSTPSKENPAAVVVAPTAVTPIAQPLLSKSALNPKVAKMDHTTSPVKSSKVTGNSVKKETNVTSNGSTGTTSNRSNSSGNKTRERDASAVAVEAVTVSTPAPTTTKIATSVDLDHQIIKAAAALSLTCVATSTSTSTPVTTTPTPTPKKEKAEKSVTVVTPVATVAATTTPVSTPTVTPSTSTSVKQEKETKKKVEVERKKMKKKKTRQSDSPPNIPDVDPDEPTYCLCDQVSYGDMVGCDNDLCPIEWFHFSCVSMTTKPKGKWFCPKCRGDRPNVMKPKAIFLKELEKYNREKEEKN